MHNHGDLFPICTNCTNAINERQRQGEVRWPNMPSTVYRAVEESSIDWRSPCPLFLKGQNFWNRSNDDLYLVATFTSAIGKCKKKRWWWLPHRLSKQCPVVPSPPFQPHPWKSINNVSSAWHTFHPIYLEILTWPVLPLWPPGARAQECGKRGNIGQEEVYFDGVSSISATPQLLPKFCNDILRVTK